MNIAGKLVNALRNVSGGPAGNPCDCADGDMHGDCQHCEARKALVEYSSVMAEGGGTAAMRFLRTERDKAQTRLREIDEAIRSLDA